MNTTFKLALASLFIASAASAQHETHSTGGMGGSALSGQYAFATIAEIVKTLKADASTDWAKVNLEALRQHLIDMDDVILRASVTQRTVPGGLQMDITGSGRTAAAIRRMVGSHAKVLEDHTDYLASVKNLPAGMRLTVTAKDSSSTATVAMIRGLGFAGIMVEGDHHAEHHLMMARGTSHH